MDAIEPGAAMMKKYEMWTNSLSQGESQGVFSNLPGAEKLRNIFNILQRA
jgi:hypothetical protein